ncbi:uncharacterized protein MONOS_18039 [Monocercomonoides exilis]|uniref:uncharacterized protein n=1 Tax=Monocercomonoides exilis TaxID=2049356 RepID=UPI00355A9199|nr:hypothetical protein MONOS_18039 [Monocercomonoides exilis]
MSCDLRNEELNTTNFASLVALSSTLNSDWSQSTSKMLETRDFWRWFASEKAVVLLCAMFVDAFINTTFSIDVCKRDSEPNTDKKGGVDKHENEVSDKKALPQPISPSALSFHSTSDEIERFCVRNSKLKLQISIRPPSASQNLEIAFAPNDTETCFRKRDEQDVTI